MLMNYLQRTLNWEIYICMKDHSLNTYLILAIVGGLILG